MASQEDDATELQFPKDKMVENGPCCCYCYSSLEFPFIHCYTCLTNHHDDVNICLLCFSRGIQFRSHKNDHDYSIKQNFTPFSQDWKAKDEISLLEAVVEYGLGNWSSIGFYVQKDKDECKKHFLETYVNSRTALKSYASLLSTYEMFQYPAHLNSVVPPRPTPGLNPYYELSGYDAVRSEFTVEYEDDAESLIGEININLTEEFQWDANLLKQLELAISDTYNRRLAERARKKHIVKEYGLINLTSAALLFHYYSSHSPHLDDLISQLPSLLPLHDFIYILEGLINSDKLKSDIYELKECRMNGLTKKTQISLYSNFKKNRGLMKKRKYKCIQDNIQLKNAFKIVPTQGQPRKGITPLDITGKPDYETLTDVEKELSSGLRLLPKTFKRLKESFIDECRKQKGLTLLHARMFFKIDVNKTRKLYDYLLNENLIYKPISK